MRTYDIEALTAIVYKLATRGFDGIFHNLEDLEYTPKDLLGMHFDIDTNNPTAEDYTGCKVIDVEGNTIFIDNKVRTVTSSMVNLFMVATSEHDIIKVVDQYDNYSKYQRKGNKWFPVEFMYTDYVRAEGKAFAPQANIRHEALLALTNHQETVLSEEFHASFDEALEKAKGVWDTVQQDEVEGAKLVHSLSKHIQ